MTAWECVCVSVYVQIFSRIGGSERNSVGYARPSIIAHNIHFVIVRLPNIFETLAWYCSVGPYVLAVCRSWINKYAGFRINILCIGSLVSSERIERHTLPKLTIRTRICIPHSPLTVNLCRGYAGNQQHEHGYNLPPVSLTLSYRHSASPRSSLPPSMPPSLPLFLFLHHSNAFDNGIRHNNLISNPLFHYRCWFTFFFAWCVCVCVSVLLHIPNA